MIKFLHAQFETYATPSLNEILGKRWAEFNWKKKYLKALAGYECYRLKTKKKMKISYYRYGSRELDHDNFVGGCKPLQDTIKEKGIIVDDRPEWLETEYYQVKCKRGLEKMVVRIEEVGK